MYQMSTWTVTINSGQAMLRKMVAKLFCSRVLLKRCSYRRCGGKTIKKKIEVRTYYINLYILVRLSHMRILTSADISRL